MNRYALVIMQHPTEEWAMYYNCDWMRGRDFRRGNPDRVGFYERGCADACKDTLVKKCEQWAEARSDTSEIIDIVIVMSLGVTCDDVVSLVVRLNERFNRKIVSSHKCIGYTPSFDKRIDSTTMARRAYLDFEYQRYKVNCEVQRWKDINA
jgi:hypothetical protein